MKSHQILLVCSSVVAVFLSIATANAGDPAFVQQAYLKGSNNAANDNFGHSMSLDGDTSVVGAPLNDLNGSNAGLVYVFVRDSGGNWSQQAVLSPALPKEGDNFGQSVAISGDTIVVGAHLEDNVLSGVNPGLAFGASDQNSGAAYVFTRSGTTWTQQAHLKASNAATGQQFGFSVAIDGDTVVVGANLEPGLGIESGAAYVFTRTGASWSEQAVLRAGDAAAGDQFGHSVGLDGDTVIVGAVQKNRVNSILPGAAYLFSRTGTSWNQDFAFYGPPGSLNRRIGQSVAVSGNLAIVGASGESSTSSGINGEEDGTGSNGAGAAYILTRSGGSWSRTAFFKASNAGANDGFGWSVAIDGRIALVGAHRETSNATGVNGDESNNTIFNAGAAYQFEFNDGQWTQTAYIKPSNTRNNMQFGRAVTLSKGTFIVGAPTENSNATTVNGDQADTSASGAGAGYVWKFQDSGPDLALETAAGVRLFSEDGVVNFPVAQVPLVVRNIGLSPLGNPAANGGVELSISGPDAAFFSLNVPALPGLIAPDGSDSFVVTFDPTGPAGTPRHATLTLASNDPTPTTFSIALSGTALSEIDDSDGDGIPDATEFRLSAFGFDWQVAQPTLVGLLFNNAAGAGLFSESQVRDLNLPTPLIKRDPATNRFTLDIGLEKSGNLDGFDPFPFTSEDTTITPEGRIEFEFQGTGDAEFFRLLAK